MERLSSKAWLLTLLREKKGDSVSGTFLADTIGISRVAVWKTVQSLMEAGYSIETEKKGYLLNPINEKDFLYPWEFNEKENLFHHYKITGSTMDRARELAFNDTAEFSVITADRQSAGRGRNGRTWVSRQGGLFFTIIEQPSFSIADYSISSLITQIAAVKIISKICGKKAFLRWPNDIYIDGRKIAGVTTEISGEGGMIKWLSCGVGINVNNPVPTGKSTSCAEITQHTHSRRDILINFLEMLEKTKKKFYSTAAYFQGNPLLAKEWNSLADCIGAKAVIFEPDKTSEFTAHKPEKIFARGTFEGIDPAGRCILKINGANMYFNQGSVSLAFFNADNR